MEIFNVKSHRLYKNDEGGRIMVRLSLIKTENASVLNRLYESLEKKYFSSAKSFIESKKDKGTYFLDVKCDVAESRENVKIKRSSTLKCGALVIKENVTFDIFEKELQKLKK